MFFLSRLSEGLFLAFALMLLSFVIGAALLPWCDEPSDFLGEDWQMLRVTTTCALGYAVLGFIAFALAVVHLMNAGVVLTCAVIAFLTSNALRKQNPFALPYWTRRMSAIARSWNGTLLTSFYIMLVLAVPAAIVTNYQFDAINYHLAYAQEWANAGRLVVDPFVQFPFYASNFLLLDALLIQLHADIFLIFIGWSVGLLCALTITALARSATFELTGSKCSSIIAISLTLAVMSCPTFLRWLSSAYVDAAIGAFALFMVVALHLALKEKRYYWLVSAAMVGAFFVGMKSSLLMLLPIAAIGIFFTSAAVHRNSKKALGCVSLFLIFASPWYVRNIILAGDPIPPTLNIALRHGDGLMTNGEWANLQKDFRHVPNRDQVLIVPLQAYIRPASAAFQDDGANLLLLFAYVPAALIALLFAARRADSVDLLYGLSSATLVGYWLFTSTLLRYSMIYYPLLAVALPLLAAKFFKVRTARLAPAILTVVALLAIIPSPASFLKMPQGTNFFSRFYYGNYRYVWGTYTSDVTYLNQFSPDYRAEEFTTAVVRKYGLSNRVYMFMPVVRYYFARHGIEALGEWVGPSGYFRFFRAIQMRRPAEFLATLNTSAVLISPRHSGGGLTEVLERQLLAAGYCRTRIPNTPDILMVKISLRSCNALVAQSREIAMTGNDAR